MNVNQVDNVVLLDFHPNERWEFLDALTESTNEAWKSKECVCNWNRVGKINNLKRYLSYFWFPFKIFLTRKKYKAILTWQQFFGIVFAFFCKLFHVKKANKLVIMTFIFKPKVGIWKKIYFEFVKYAIDSEYVDKIICFSSAEPHYYATLFSMDEKKFAYVPLGEELPTNLKKQHVHREGVVSVGFSNRDYEFLIRVFRGSDYKLKIYADKDAKIENNIIMSSEILGDGVEDVLNKCKILVIPLKDKNISAGQLTVLHAMQLGVPVIATKSNGISDFITDDVNGYLVENEESEWRLKISELLTNNDIYNRMSKATNELYQKKHTIKSMGKSIGIIFNNL